MDGGGGGKIEGERSVERLRMVYPIIPNDMVWIRVRSYLGSAFVDLS